MAVKDVGTRFKNGASGEALAKYVADTYFVHPALVKNEWITQVNDILKKWKEKNPLIINKLKFPTIYHEHAPAVMRDIKKFGETVDQTYNNAKREFEAFKKNPTGYTRRQAVEVKKTIVRGITEMNDQMADKINKNPTLKKSNDWLLEQRKKMENTIEKIKHMTLD